MKWKGRRESSNVEDRRGMNGKMVMGGGIGGIIIILLFTLLGGNPGELINSISTNNEADSNASDSNAPYQESAQEKELADFVSVVLADTGMYGQPSLIREDWNTKILSLFYIAAAFSRPADLLVQWWGRFIVQVTTSCTLT